MRYKNITYTIDDIVTLNELSVATKILDNLDPKLALSRGPEDRRLRSPETDESPHRTMTGAFKINSVKSLLN